MEIEQPTTEEKEAEVVYERAILEACADTFQFNELPGGEFWKCRICGIRFHVNYAGRALTMRMADHAANHHGIGPRPLR
jgi:hypothetical protein